MNSTASIFGESGAQVMLGARNLAREIGGELIGTEHLLLEMAGVSDGATEFLLTATGVKYDDFYEKVVKYFGYARKRADLTAFSPRVKKIIQRARFLADGELVEHHHILEAFIGEPECPARMVLYHLGVDPNRFEQEVLAAIGQEKLVREFVASLNSPDL